MRYVLLFLALTAACYTPPIAPATPSAWQITGDGQTGVPGYRLANPIVVRVVGTDGRPIVGDTIDFTASDPRALVEPGPAAPITDSTGSAMVYWRIGPTLGTQTLSAHSRVPGVNRATITATSTSNYVQSIAGSDLGMCAVDMHGHLACWLPPRLGTPNPATRFVAVTAPVNFSQVTMLAGEGCALADTGRPWCFTIDTLANVAGLAELAGAYPALTQIVSDANYGASYCGLTAVGEAWCWGNNVGGELGDGTMIARATPTAVPTATRFSELDMGGATVCGVTAAGEAWCWGNNNDLQAGVPAIPGTNAGTPLPVNTPLRFTKVRTLGVVTCGFVVAGGLSCWGFLEDFGLQIVSTAVPTALSSSPLAVDIIAVFDRFRGPYDVLFDQRGGLDIVGLGFAAGNQLSLTASGSATGLLSNIQLVHGGGYTCGTAALGGATLCPSLRQWPLGDYVPIGFFWRPAVVGVPLP
jgi:hypothetical protein